MNWNAYPSGKGFETEWDEFIPRGESEVVSN